MELDKQEQEPIKLLNLFIRYKNVFVNLWPVILILAVLLGSFTAIRDKRGFIPMYEAKAIFTVDAGYNPGDIFGSAAYYDQYAAEQLAAAFPRLMTTDMMRDLVNQQVPKGYANGTPNAVAVADSNMLRLTVVSNDPQDAYDYLVALIDCFPRVAGNMVENPQVKIVSSPTDPNEVPPQPINSYQPVKSALKGGLIGVALGLLIILGCALLTRTIQTTDEMKESVNIPILVALPKVDKKKRRNGQEELITAESDLNMTESFRGLRVKIKKILENKTGKSILITSTLAGEGKTTVAINMALSLKQDGHKVVLLDADLRSQSVARSLGEKATGFGMMDCLRDENQDPLDCVRVSEKHQLEFISARSTDKRHYFIDGKAVDRVIAQLLTQYDYVVIDTPPCDIVSDTAELCRHADSVIYVVKQDYAQKGQVLNAITALHEKDVKITGIIFNGVPRFHRQYGYGYKSAYGYGYDYGYRKYAHSSQYGYGKYGYSKYASKYTGKTSERRSHSHKSSHHSVSKTAGRKRK